MALQVKIVTPRGLMYDDEAEKVLARTTSGEVGILPRHIDFAAALTKGKLKITKSDSVRMAEVSGGMIYVAHDEVRILANDFEWNS